MAAILKRLGIFAEKGEGGTLTVKPPFTRLDLLEEIDIVEEVARIYGYDKLGSTHHSDRTEAGVTESWALRSVLREVLTGLGLSEIQTYSFVSPAGVALIGAEDDPDKNAFVRLINPLGEENSVMRTTLLPALLESLARNYNRSAGDCRLFEIGTVFKNHLNEEGLPKETLSLSMGMYGEGADFFYLKGCIETVFLKFGLEAPVFEPVTDDPAFHPGRCAGFDYGIIGEIHPDVAERFDLGTRVCCAELDLTGLAGAADMDRDYKPLAKYPAVLRDVALLVDDETPVSRLLGIIKQRGGRILEKAELFDVYRGKQVPEGKKSLAFNLTFRSGEKTLTDEDAQKAMTKILKGLADETGAALRE